MYTHYALDPVPFLGRCVDLCVQPHSDVCPKAAQNRRNQACVCCEFESYQADSSHPFAWRRLISLCEWKSHSAPHSRRGCFNKLHLRSCAPHYFRVFSRLQGIVFRDEVWVEGRRGT